MTKINVPNLAEPSDLPPKSRAAWRELVNLVKTLAQAVNGTNDYVASVDRNQSNAFTAIENLSVSVAEQGAAITDVQETYAPTSAIERPSPPILTTGTGIITVEWDGDLFIIDEVGAGENVDPTYGTPVRSPYTDSTGFKHVVVEWSETGLPDPPSPDPEQPATVTWFPVGAPMAQPGKVTQQVFATTTRYYRMYAVNYAGEQSGYSEVRSITAVGVGLTDLKSDVVEQIDTALEDAQSAANDAADALVKSSNMIKASQTDPGQEAGRLWLQQDANGDVIGVKISNGTAWTNYTLMAGQILVPGSVGTVQIANGAVTGPLIQGDAIDGKTITGATIRTAASGTRLQLDAFGLRAFGASGGSTATLFSESGGMRLNGNLWLGSATSPGSLSSTYLTLGQTNDTKMLLGHSTTPEQSSSIELYATTPVADKGQARMIVYTASATDSETSHVSFQGELRPARVNQQGLFQKNRLNKLTVDTGNTSDMIYANGDLLSDNYGFAVGTTNRIIMSGQNSQIQGVNTNGSPGPLNLSPAGGDVRIGPDIGGTSKLYINGTPLSLEDTGWVGLPLRAGYLAHNGRTPQVRRKNGVVYMRGGFAPSGGGSFSGTAYQIAADLPSGFGAPTQNSYFVAFTGTNGSSGIISVEGSTVRITPGSATVGYIYLNNVVYFED